MTPGQVIRREDLPLDFCSAPRKTNGEPACFQCATLKEARSSFERDFLLKKLEENGWNISATASMIGLERTHLHRKMKALGIKENGLSGG
jgi:two-component system nitrogen regulation response regulator NtrX